MPHRNKKDKKGPIHSAPISGATARSKSYRVAEKVSCPSPRRKPGSRNPLENLDSGFRPNDENNYARAFSSGLLYRSHCNKGSGRKAILASIHEHHISYDFSGSSIRCLNTSTISSLFYYRDSIASREYTMYIL